jgi:hypothetical protein
VQVGAGAVAGAAGNAQQCAGIDGLIDIDQRLLHMSIDRLVTIGMFNPDVNAVVMVVWVSMNEFNPARGNAKQAAAQGGLDVQPFMAGQVKADVEITIDAEKLVNDPKFSRPRFKLKAVHLFLHFVKQFAKLFLSAI